MAKNYLYILLLFFFTFSIKPNFLFLRDHNENKDFAALFLCHPSQNFQFILVILFSLMFFKEVIEVLSYMYCFWPTYIQVASRVAEWLKI